MSRKSVGRAVSNRGASFWWSVSRGKLPIVNLPQCYWFASDYAFRTEEVLVVESKRDDMEAVCVLLSCCLLVRFKDECQKTSEIAVFLCASDFGVSLNR